MTLPQPAGPATNARLVLLMGVFYVLYQPAARAALASIAHPETAVVPHQTPAAAIRSESACDAMAPGEGRGQLLPIGRTGQVP